MSLNVVTYNESMILEEAISALGVYDPNPNHIDYYAEKLGLDYCFNSDSYFKLI